jgi:Tfp pilus assembly major pilin PilA
MKNKINNQNGFSIIEFLVIIVILAVIGVAGWLVYKDHHKTTPVDATSTSTSTKNTSNASTSSKQVVTYASYDKAPSDIQTAVTLAWYTASPGYKTDPISSCNTSTITQSQNTIYTENNDFVIVGAGCSGGSEQLLVKTNSTWQDVASTQDDFECSVLTQYNVPTNLVVAAMSATSGGQVQCVLTGNNVKTLS